MSIVDDFPNSTPLEKYVMMMEERLSKLELDCGEISENIGQDMDYLTTDAFSAVLYYPFKCEPSTIHEISSALESIHLIKGKVARILLVHFNNENTAMYVKLAKRIILGVKDDEIRHCIKEKLNCKHMSKLSPADMIEFDQLLAEAKKAGEEIYEVTRRV